ncbi:unnamed protein product [Alopecurus aequalis]
MAAEITLNRLMSNMFATGLLDAQFRQLQMLQNGGDPDFVEQVVTLFCEDGERIIGEIAKLLNKLDVDFDKVDAFAGELKGSSLCVGAQRVKNTCMQFREFCQDKSRNGCLNTLYDVRNDFYELRNRFETMLQGHCLKFT